MSLQIGDVVLARLPLVTRPGAKVRPVLVVQDDTNNARMTNTIVAFITTNTSRSHLPTQVLIDITTPEGQQSGLLAESVVTCENLITIAQSQARKIGNLPPSLLRKVDDALKASLGLA